MSASVGGGGRSGAATSPGVPDPVGATSSRSRLYEAAQALEGVFAQHLVKAMRTTVPGGGSPDAPGADLYGALLDEHLAQTVAGDTRSGIADAIYRQLTAGASPPKTESR